MRGPHDLAALLTGQKYSRIKAHYPFGGRVSAVVVACLVVVVRLVAVLACVVVARLVVVLAFVVVVRLVVVPGCVVVVRLVVEVGQR